MLSDYTISQIQQWSQYLHHNFSQFKRFDVSYGKSGLALFFLYKYKLKKDTDDLAIFHELVADAVQQMINMESKDQYFIQLTELAFFLHLYQEEISQQLDTVELQQQIEEMLLQAAHLQLQQNNLDGFSGAGFQTYYFLKTATNKHLPATFIHKIDGLLQQQGGDYGLSLHPDQPVQAGIIHGISFLLLVLSQCIQADILPDTCRRLLSGFSTYLLAQQQKAAIHGCYFPDSLGQSSFSRLNICYGDTGIFTALLKTASVTADSSLNQFVETGVLFNAARHAMPQNGIVDNSILYGYSGIYLWLKRIQQDGEIALPENVVGYWEQQQHTHLHHLVIPAPGTSALGLKPLSFAEGITGQFITLMSGQLNDYRFSPLLYLP